jgi:hypothetical protein
MNKYGKIQKKDFSSPKFSFALCQKNYLVLVEKTKTPSPKINWLDLTCFHERFVKNLNYKNVKNPLQVSF